MSDECGGWSLAITTTTTLPLPLPLHLLSLDRNDDALLGYTMQACCFYYYLDFNYLLLLYTYYFIYYDYHFVQML